jgi:predicted nucleotidyltransferase
MSITHGLSEQTVKKLQSVFAGFPQVEKAVLYGSRANGNFKPGSDIDLTLMGDKIDDRLSSRIYWALDDLLLPYQIDLSLFSKLRHPELIDHIRRVGVSLYERAAIEAPALE